MTTVTVYTLSSVPMKPKKMAITPPADHQPGTPQCTQPHRREVLFFFVVAHLHGEVTLVAEFLDQVHLRFEPVDVALFVLQ